MQGFEPKTGVVGNAPWRRLFVDGEEEEGGRGRNRERSRCLVRRGGVVGPSRRVGRARLPSCVKNFSPKAHLPGVRQLGIGCLQNISNVARGRWSKSHLRVRRRAADSSRYAYWPWTAKVGFYILAEFAPQASSCTRLKSLRLSFGGTGPLSAEKCSYFGCAPPRALNGTEPPPLEKNYVIVLSCRPPPYDSHVWRMCTWCCASLSITA